MTFFGMALITAIATVVLAVFAIVVAWYNASFKENFREHGSAARPATE